MFPSKYLLRCTVAELNPSRSSNEHTVQKLVFGLFILGESHSTCLIFMITHAHHGIHRTYARLLGRNIVKKYRGILLPFTEDRYDIETSHAVRSQLFRGCFSITLPLDTSMLAHYLLSTISPKLRSSDGRDTCPHILHMYLHLGMI